MDTKLSIITPCFYNGDALQDYFKAITDLEQKMNEQGTALELILIDDGSRDNTYERMLEIKRQRPATKIIKLARNFGAVPASALGFDYVKGDCFTVLAADLQDPPEMVLKMLASWKAGNKFTLCRRTARKDPLGTRIFSAVYYRLLRFFVLSNYPEGGFDMMLLDRQLLPNLQALNNNVNYQLYTYWLGFEPNVLEYERQERRHGKSRWTFGKKLNLFLDNLTGFSVLPLRLVTAFGLGIALISMLYGIHVIVAAVFNKMAAPGFATLAVLISFSAGILMTMVAIIGEYIWRIFEVVHQKPTTVIDEKHLDEDSV